MTMKPGWTDR